MSFHKLTYRFPSPTVTGVAFVVKRLNVVERAKLELLHAEDYDRLAEIQRQIEALGPQAEDSASEQPATKINILKGLVSSYEMQLYARVLPVVVRAGLQRVDGFEGDVEAFLSTALDELVTQAYIFVEMAGRRNRAALEALENATGTDVPVKVQEAA